MQFSRAKLLVTAALLAFFGFAGVAHAGGGNYVFDGGTPAQQAQVTSALAASSFNWSLVTQQVTITIAPIGRDYSLPGHIYLDSGLLSTPGDYSWGVVQNEYANEVDFFLLPAAAHATFNTAVGGTAWCYDDEPGLNMTQYGCERFASTLAWSYWQSPDNCIKPTASGGISGGMAPAAFKALLSTTLGVQTETAAPPVAGDTFTVRQPAPSTTTPVGSAQTTTTKTKLGHPVRVSASARPSSTAGGKTR